MVFSREHCASVLWYRSPLSTLSLYSVCCLAHHIHFILTNVTLCCSGREASVRCCHYAKGGVYIRWLDESHSRSTRLNSKLPSTKTKGKDLNPYLDSLNRRILIAHSFDGIGCTYPISVRCLEAMLEAVRDLHTWNWTFRST